MPAVTAAPPVPGPANPVALPAVSTIPDVIARLDGIQAYVEAQSPRGANDGVACFNYLYLQVTKDVLDKVDTGFFSDPDFLTRLDLVFANRYLDALRADAADPSRAPSSWKALLEARSDTEIAPMQFAVAGVNAHVNFDLPCTVVATCQQDNRAPDFGSQKADYDKVNQIFGEHMAALRQHFEGRLERWLDQHLFDAVADHLGGWSVVAARDTAWANANVLWSLRQNHLGEDDFVSSLDRLTGLAGRGVLAHV
jgi:uncharacterized protein DUF5995